MHNNTLLMIPGPTSVDLKVLHAMSQEPLSHTSKEFIEIFGSALSGLRHVFLSENGQPFVVAASGTLAMEMGAANLLEPGDRMLLISTGYFSDRYATICRRLGADVDVLKAPIGTVPTIERASEMLAEHAYKLLVVTHVDTSTGVATDVKAFGALAKKYDILFLVDGVCATAGMEFRQDAWGVDVCITGSQKAFAVPPGLAIMMVSERALEVRAKRIAPMQGYYLDWHEWLPIMRAYEQRGASYFATPAITLVAGLEVAVHMILAEGMEVRWNRHRTLSLEFKSRIESLGFTQLASEAIARADTMTALYLSSEMLERFTTMELIGAIKNEGVIVAGGILSDIRDKYFRVGHMGNVTAKEIARTISAITNALSTLSMRK
jgi:alanine-glyoxylate transaminase/serine-glyoxylate transaminase/serine-pyruvate transaminase